MVKGANMKIKLIFLALCATIIGCQRNHEPVDLGYYEPTEKGNKYVHFSENDAGVAHYNVQQTAQSNKVSVNSNEAVGQNPANIPVQIDQIVIGEGFPIAEPVMVKKVTKTTQTNVGKSEQFGTGRKKYISESQPFSSGIEVAVKEEIITKKTIDSDPTISSIGRNSGADEAEIKDWIAKEGLTLRELLTSWSDEAGWRLVWNMNRDYTLQAGAVFRGRYADVSAALIRSFARARPAPMGVFYKGNKVLVISSQEDENAE